MTAKRADNFLERFNGSRGRGKLAAVVADQTLVRGDLRIAKALISAGTLREVRAGAALTAQGSSTSEIYLILSGDVSVSVNKRLLAKRQGGAHVGEMALIDPTARRSATLTAVVRTAMLVIDEPGFTRIADRYPIIWRRIGVELASRLRERNRFHPEPHDEPIIFIGSSGEALPVAQVINNSLSRRPAIPKLWSKDVFEASKTTIEDLYRLSAESDFGVLVLTPDDITVSRGIKKLSPRDNVIFELGLFIGALGRERTIIVKPSGVDIKIPTDLMGVTRLEYQDGSSRTISRRLRSVNSGLWRAITRLGPK
jgi:predicted nucleotide-binding protein